MVVVVVVLRSEVLGVSGGGTVLERAQRVHSFPKFPHFPPIFTVPFLLIRPMAAAAILPVRGGMNAMLSGAVGEPILIA